MIAHWLINIKRFPPEQSDIASLDKAIAKNPEAVKNFAAATESTQPKDVTDNPEKGKPIQNKIDGLRREAEVQAELEKQYPADKGYEIVPEAYLRDARGNIVKDPVTGNCVCSIYSFFQGYNIGLFADIHLILCRSCFEFIVR